MKTLKGSTIYKDAADSLNVGIKKNVEQCRTNGQIVNDILQVNKVFTSSSSAAAFAAGYSISGPQQWKTENGEPLNHLKRKTNRIIKNCTQNALKRQKETPKTSIFQGFRGFFILLPLGAL